MNKKRVITLTIAMALSVGIAVPLTTSLTEASKNHQVKKKTVKYRKYSRQWWRQYRAKARRNRIVAERRREMALLGRDNNRAVKLISVVDSRSNAMNKPVSNWSGESISPNGEAKYRLSDDNGTQIGSAQLSIVGAAMPESENRFISAKQRAQMLGGVATNNFRRAVIDRIVRENGWVTNDYSKEIAGKKVFIVTAQTPTAGGTNSRAFYFTEIDGRIYNLTTTVPEASSEKIAADAEQFLQKLQRGNSNHSAEVSAATSLQ